ncbi:MAG: prepilin-type N-terminal cleavage/methylation domain-containing protein [Gammaproteobacteria bacterium]
MYFLRQSRGFTLIELVMVMIIITSVLFVMIQPASNVDTIEQANKLRSDIRYIKYLAQTQNQTTRGRINFSSSQYTLTLQDGVTAIIAPNATSNVIPLISGVTLTMTNIPNGYLVFDGLGRPYTDNAGTLLASVASVTLTNSYNTVTITINPDTGQVQ